MSGQPKDKLAQIADVISKMIGQPYPPYSLLSTPFAFYGKSRIYEKKGDADKAYKRADALIKKSRALELALEKLPDEQANIIFQSAYSSLKLDRSTLENIPHLTLQDWLYAIKAGAKFEADRIQNEIENSWNTGDRQPNIQAQDVANAIAEIYVRETCSYPTVGHNDQAPTGKFCIAVAAIFKIIGIAPKFRSPSEKARENVIENFDLEDARRDLARRTLIQRALGIEVGKRKAGSAPKSLIS